MERQFWCHLGRQHIGLHAIQNVKRWVRGKDQVNVSQPAMVQVYHARMGRVDYVDRALLQNRPNLKVQSKQKMALTIYCQCAQSYIPKKLHTERLHSKIVHVLTKVLPHDLVLIHVLSYPMYYLTKYALIILTICLSNGTFKDAMYKRKIAEYVLKSATNHCKSRLVSSYTMNRRPM